MAYIDPKLTERIGGGKMGGGGRLFPTKIRVLSMLRNGQYQTRYQLANKLGLYGKFYDKLDEMEKVGLITRSGSNVKITEKGYNLYKTIVELLL